MPLIAGYLLALVAAAEWAVDAQTDQQAIAALRTAAVAGTVSEASARAAGFTPEVLDRIAQKATCAGQAASVKALVAAGARPRQFGPAGLDCLLKVHPEIDAAVPPASVEVRWTELATFLVDVGVPPAPLLAPAAAHCAEGIALLAIARGADVNRPDVTGAAPIARSLRCAGDLFDRLLAHGASTKDQPGQVPLLHQLALLPLDQPLFEARLHALLQGGADLNARDRNGATPLAYACDARSPRVLTLLAAKVDPNLADRGGVTPLMQLMRHGSPCAALEARDAGSRPGSWAMRERARKETECRQQVELLEALLGAGANPRAEDHKGRDALEEAARSGCRPCLEKLAEHGVGPDTANKAGQPPLHRAAVRDGHGDTGAIGTLVHAGAHLSRRDAKGRTPYEVAKEAGTLSEVGHLLALPTRPLQPLSSASASSTLVEQGRPPTFYAPGKAIDGTFATCWCKGVPGHGIGEWLQVDLKKAAKIRGLRVYPGCGADDATYFANNQISELRVVAGDASKEVYLSPERRFTDVAFDTKSTVSSLRLTILAVAEDDMMNPRKYDDTCIGEIQVDLE